MNRLTIAFLSAALVLGLLVTAPFVALGSTADDTSSNPSVAPGERVMGVVGAQGAEMSNEVSERSFGLSIAQAETAEAQADIVADRLQANIERLDEIEQRLETLHEQREAGEISEGKYQAQVAKLEVERQSIERTTAEIEVVASGMPVELLEERGINVTAINELRESASQLGGEEVRDIARSIAGEGVGAPADTRPSVEDRVVGQSRGISQQMDRADSAEEAIDIAASWTERAENQVDRVEYRLAGVDIDEDVQAHLDRANDELDAANAALEDANAALEAGDEEAAIEHANAAAEHAANAIEAASDAWNEVRGPPGDDPGNGIPGERPD